MESATRLFSESEGKLLTIKLGNQEYGIPILEAREVVKMMAIEPIPQTPAFMRGVLNLRGHIHPVIDLRTKFSMEPKEDTPETCIILVNLVGQATGMVADQLIGVTTLEPSSFEENPDLGHHINNRFLLGIAKLEERVILVLNLDEVLNNDELLAISESITA